MIIHWHFVGQIATIVLLLMLTALFSGAETALTAASAARMHRLEAEGIKRAIIVNALITDRERLIGSLLLGNTLINILASALATDLFLHLFGDAGVAIATVVMTVMILVFAEVLPKTYAISSPERSAMAIAPLIRLIVTLFAPLVELVRTIVRGILRVFGIRIDKTREVLSAHDEIRGHIDLKHSEGDVFKEERDMLGGILDLAELEVGELMVHRKAMEIIDADMPSTEIVSLALKSPHTRLPLYRGEPDNIVGVLHAKDLLRGLAAARGRVEALDVKSLAKKPWFVPDTTPVKEQLNAFLRQRNHFALVVDEYGTLMGLVTLEDILEEIVGDIRDEHDIKSQGIRPQEGGSVQVDGAVAIRELNRVMDWNLPDEEATTVAGLVIHEAQTIPEPGQAFAFHGFKFEILRKQRNQITALRITKLPEAEVSAA
ncbi:MAG: HlyC/CorC family transporter [Alphaproteobacteria bacterium]